MGKTGLPSLGMGHFVATFAEEAKEKFAGAAAAGSETKTADFDVLVDLEKTFGVAEVIARAKVLDTSSDAIKKWMSNTVVQGYVENAISRRVTKELSDLHKKYLTLDMAGAKIKEGVAAAGDKAKEVVAKAKEAGGLGRSA